VHEGFEWHDQLWDGILLQHYIIYELHVGTFTPEGTFDGVVNKLDQLKDLGITAIELMPVAQFPGSRNWGYDGTYPFAVQDTYGGVDGLKRLINECHRRSLAVVLDVVYNHLGPEGNYLSEYGPYFTPRYATPWGEGLNFDGEESDQVRRFWLENALRWVTEFHVDALRLDAVHAILDFSVRPFLLDLSVAVHARAEALNRRIYLIAECDRSDPRTVHERARGGYAMDAVWNDGFHHSLHTALTDERRGYYVDYDGLMSLAKAYRHGFVYSGQYSRYRRRRHGASSTDIPAKRFVVFAQNHDQIGNRATGDRLASTLSREGLKLAAAVVLLSPFLPLIFMGEEYGETAPFTFFVSHGDPDLNRAVREGRRAEFESFDWTGEILDPESEETFLKSKLNWDRLEEEPHRTIRSYFKNLIRLRKSVPALASLSKKNQEVLAFPAKHALMIFRSHERSQTFAVFQFSDQVTSFMAPVPAGSWQKELDSADAQWGGPGSLMPDRIDSEGEVEVTLGPCSVLLLRREL
jgi:maltooligosyltrehalose trehalohydrolase